MLGIIGAMDEEVAKLKEKMEQVHIIEKAGMQFYRGTLCDHEVVVVKCGVGKVHAAMCTQAMISADYTSGKDVDGKLCLLCCGKSKLQHFDICLENIFIIF